MTIEAYVTECRERINRALDGYLSQDSYVVHEAARDMVLRESHRWRPIVLIVSAEMYDQNSLDKVMPHACAAELMHKASLIFDDLPCMDDAETRSGGKACHVKYGESNAILAALYLIFRGYELCDDNDKIPHDRRVESTQIISKMGEEATLGQEMDLKSSKLPLDKKLLTYINENKTAKLFAASAKIGGLLVGTSLKDQENLYNFGKNLGIAYQYWDDIREIEYNEPTTSKINPNAVKIIGMEETKEAHKRHKDLAIKFLEPFGEKTNTLRELTECMFQQK